VTLAIVSNCLSLIALRAHTMRQSTGVDEAQLLTFNVFPIDAKTFNAQAAFLTQRAALLALPGVENAYLVDELPLSGSGSFTSVSTRKDDARDIGSGTYHADENTLATLGLTLVAGRNFASSEIVSVTGRLDHVPSAVIITQALAKKLYPDSSALGKRLMGGDNDPNGPEIIGIVRQLVTPWPTNDEHAHVTLMPVRASAGFTWVIRAASTRIEALKKEAPEMIAKLDRACVVSFKSARSMLDIRTEAFDDDHAMIVLMLCLSLMLIGVTALGIVGMSTFWVTSRTKQIGTRRALGASMRAIVRDFQRENLLLSGVGASLGILLAYALSFAFSHLANLPPVSAVYVAAGVGLVLLLGQVAVYRPALRASRVSPAIATRTI
jgi:putative ABC transport system permease protein